MKKIKKLIDILTSPRVAVAILYAVVSVWGAITGVDYLTQGNTPPEVIPIKRQSISYEDELKAMQSDILALQVFQNNQRHQINVKVKGDSQ